MLKSHPPLPVEDAEALRTANAPPELYTYDDVAGAMRVSRQTVYEWVKTGKIVSPIYNGHSARFTADMLADIMAGVKPAGSFTPAESPRAAIGLKGWKAKVKKAKKLKSAARAKTAKTSPAKTSPAKTAKKPAAKGKSK